MLSQLSNWPLAALELEGIKTISVSFSDLYTRISPWFSQYSILETQQSWTPEIYLVVLQSRNQELWNTFTALKILLSKQGTKQDSASDKSHLEKQKKNQNFASPKWHLCYPIIENFMFPPAWIGQAKVYVF